MIRMVQSRSPAQAKAYFSDALAKADYYLNDQEMAGFWQGKLADRLALNGWVNKDSFFALCENVHPQTGGHLTPRTREERTTGYDINFHCPKSVSILHALSGDNHILTVFQESVSEVMQTIEADARTRIRTNGQVDERATGELVWAHFTHQTARPVEGFLPDPHLHSHCFVFNATWDDTEQRFKAGQFRDIKRDMPYYQARFHKTLSDKLAALGYAIRKTDKTFEIEGVPQQAIDLFSKRTDAIGRVAKELGITDADEKAELGARTRAKKQKGASMADLKREWLKQVNDLNIDKAEAAKAIRHAPQKDAPTLTAAQCLDYALLDGFERASVLADRRVLEAAYKRAIGNTGVSVGAITEVFKADQRIIHVTDHGRNFCTTREVLKEERDMVELARKGRGKIAPLYTEAPPINLTGQQGAAIAEVLTTPNRVSIVRGAAGSGKTTLMKEAAEKIEAAGMTLTVIAPSAQASRGVLREEAGFAGAETVARFLLDKKMQEAVKGQVLWVDEAGLLGTKDMLALLKVATEQNAQLVLGGDTRQHASVVRGDALRILSTVAGIRSAEVSKIFRQQNADYREAVEHLAKGHIKEAFEKLDGLDFIHTVDPLQPNTQLVEDYVATVKKGKGALVVCPTHAQGEAITQAIRERLRADKLLGEKEITVARFKSLNMTEAEKSDPRNFKAGQLVKFNQNLKGIRRGSVWTVEQTTDTAVYLKNAEGNSQVLPTENSQHYSVYERRDIGLSKGDKVMITDNGFDVNGKRLNNGQTLEVTGFSKEGHIVLRNDLSHETYTLTRSHGHITHAHCITSHASQGKNIDEVFIYQPAATFPATDAKQFYVSVSRGKIKAHIYTDDKAELLHHASEMGERKSALEVVGQSKLKKNFIERKRERQQEKTKTKGQKPRTKIKGYNHDFDK